MSHSRVSLGRTASPCITERWGRPPRRPGAGKCAREGPGPGLQGAPLTAPFLPPPPSPPSSRLGCLLVRAISLCGARRGGYSVRRLIPCPQRASRRPPVTLYLKKKKKSGRGQVIHWDRWSPQHHPGHLKKECALPSGLPLEEPIVGLAWRPHLDYRSLGPTKSKLWISQVSRSSFTRPYISPVSHTWAGTEMHTQTPVRAGETKEPRYLGGGGGG